MNDFRVMAAVKRRRPGSQRSDGSAITVKLGERYMK